MSAPRLIPHTGDRVNFAEVPFANVRVSLVRQGEDIVTVNVLDETQPRDERRALIMRPWVARALAAVLIAAADEANRQGGGEGGTSL